jgi:hypothetical protein
MLSLGAAQSLLEISLEAARRLLRHREARSSATLLPHLLALRHKEAQPGRDSRFSGRQLRNQAVSSVDRTQLLLLHRRPLPQPQRRPRLPGRLHFLGELNSHKLPEVVCLDLTLNKSHCLEQLRRHPVVVVCSAMQPTNQRNQQPQQPRLTALRNPSLELPRPHPPGKVKARHPSICHPLAPIKGRNLLSRLSAQLPQPRPANPLQP